MGKPNPFDFSDFGPQSRPASVGAEGSVSQQGTDFSTGFDPWGNKSRSRPSPPEMSGRRGSTDAFGDAMDTGTLTTAGPPLKWLAVTLGLALVGVALALASAAAGGAEPGTALAGWLLTGPLAIGALAVYTRVDTLRRSETIYSAPRWAAKAYWVVLAVCLGGIALSAWQIALWAGRQ
jgi:hypothetical protein